MAQKDFALGSFEAAALLGMHWTRPRLMAARGMIQNRQLGVGRGEKAAAVYSLRSCEADFREYEDRVAANGGKHYRRPRAWLHLRPQALRRLAKEKNPIEFDDACSVRDAMNMMRLVSTSQLTRLINTGEIVGRKAWNPRGGAAAGGSSLWIVSRKSVEERLRRIVAAEAAGKKPGIRKWVKKKS